MPPLLQKYFILVFTVILGSSGCTSTNNDTREKPRNCYLENIKKHDSKTSELPTFYMARAAAQKGEFESAIAELEKITPQHKGEADYINFWLGTLYLEQGKYTKAIDYLAPLVSKNELSYMDKHSLFNALTYSYHQENMYEEEIATNLAIMQFSCDPNNEYTNRMIAASYMALERWEDMYQYATVAVKNSTSSNKWDYLNAIQVAKKEANYEQLATVFKRYSDQYSINAEYSSPIKNTHLLLKAVAPNYPVHAALNGIEGFVQLKFNINEAGQTEDIQVIKSIPEGVFDAYALKAVSQWVYQPIIKGQKQRSEGQTVQLDFNL